MWAYGQHHRYRHCIRLGRHGVSDLRNATHLRGPENRHSLTKLPKLTVHGIEIATRMLPIRSGDDRDRWRRQGLSRGINLRMRRRGRRRAQGEFRPVAISAEVECDHRLNVPGYPGIDPRPQHVRGLGQQLDNASKMFAGAEVSTILIIFMLLVAMADRLSAWLREELA